MSDASDSAAVAAAKVRSITDTSPRLGVILGSGLGPIAEAVSAPAVIPYSEIPHFPVPTVEGHAGNLVCGSLYGIPAAVMQGRFHYYEGYHMRELTFPVRVLAELGARTVIVTNASGGIGERLMPGDIAVVTDHINLMGANPMMGATEEEGNRFLDLTGAYDPGLAALAAGAAMKLGIALPEAVLAAVAGPCYETPAEVRMLSALGADAVCMSSVPEVIMARHLGMRVLCLTLVTNRAAGLSDTSPRHSEVLSVAAASQDAFARLVEETVLRMAEAGVF